MDFYVWNKENIRNDIDSKSHSSPHKQLETSLWSSDLQLRGDHPTNVIDFVTTLTSKGLPIESQDEQNHFRISNFFQSSIATPFENTYYESPSPSSLSSKSSYPSLHHDDLHLSSKIALHRFNYVNSEADLLELRQLEAGERYNRLVKLIHLTSLTWFN